MSLVRVFGIRHHGPGSARSLLTELGAFEPDILLVEGPPEGNDLLEMVTHPEMQPPVALLVYDPSKPENSAFYPFAEFSPEWVALRFAAERGIPARFIDLPVGSRGEGEPEEREDPLGDFAEAAGYDDHERWWDAMVERRQGPSDLFEAIEILMTEARSGLPSTPEEEAREAHMRQQIRRAKREGFERISVVCGAWHVPALTQDLPASRDEATLKGRTKPKHVATWVPWTYDRLGAASGYRAGVLSPAYYEHLWRSEPSQVATGWLLKTARLLREEDLDASPASVIEAVRLADALSAIRGHSVPGLEELREAAWSVLCGGDHVPMGLIERRLVVGERLGRVPDDIPLVPLQADLAGTQRRLRLQPESLERTLNLDLRGEMDLGRSHLLHRLRLLNIPWGEPISVSGKAGTFHEHWRLAWRPEFAIALIEASRWGATVADATTAFAVHSANGVDELPDLGELAGRTLLANLPDAVPPVMRRLGDVAAVASDVGQLMDALPPLASTLRYGDVRRSGSEAVAVVFEALFARVCVGLPAACASLDDEASVLMMRRIDAVEAVVSLLESEEQRENWHSALRGVADSVNAQGRVVGRSGRLLFDAGHLTSEEIGARLSRLASPGTAAPAVAHWLEGFLGSSGQILLHDERLLTLIDDWVTGLDGETFDDLLPLLRRTFAAFPRPERRQIGEHLSDGRSVKGSGDLAWDQERAERVIPLIRKILGRAEEAPR